MEKIEVLESEISALGSVQEKIDAMNALAWELRYDDIPRAIALSQAARELASQGEFKAQPYQKGLAESLCNLGHCYERLADYNLALPLLHEALSLFEAMTYLPGHATVLHLIGGTYWSLGDYYNALNYELKAIKICGNIGDKLGLGKALNIIGLVHQSVGDAATALNYFLQSLQTYEGIGFKRGQGDALSNSCEACFDLREYQQALTYGLKSLQIHEEINYRRDIGVVLVAIGRVYLALHEHAQAFDYLRRALDISRETGNRYSELRALLYLGDIYGRQGVTQIALSFLHQAEVMAQELGAQQEQYESYQVLASVYKQMGNFEKALTSYEQFYTLKQKVLEEIVRHRLRILEVVSELEAARREAETQRLKNIELEQAAAERQQAEEALAKRTTELEETSNMLNGVIENLPVMLFMKDAETLRFTRFNKAAEDLVGLGRDRLIGKNDHDFFPPEQADFFVSKDREVLAGGIVVEVAEEPIQTTHQGMRLLYTRKAPILAVDGKPKYLLGVSIDITERKQIEEALVLQQKRLRSLYEITTQAELEVDHQFKAALEIGTNLLNLDIGIISQIEGNRYTILHFHAPAVPLGQGQTFELGQTYCDLTFKADEVISIHHMGQSQFKSHPCYQAFQLEAYLGVPLWVGGRRFGTLNFSSPSPRETPFSQADQDFVELMGKWVSTTIERKQAEMALAQARDQALEASRLKSQLLAKVSHELRTPLGAILGYTELLQKGYFGSLSDKQLKAAEEVIDSTHYLTNLVNDLLDQAQVETGKVNLNVNSLSVAEMVNQVESKMIVLAQAKGLTLTTNIAGDLPSTLIGDQNRLQQILVNLISNAIKFTKTGGVQVRLYQAGPAHWAIQVADTGIGIPVEAQAYIFEPFRQVDDSTTRRHIGIGLGLSIVKQLTALMGGQITVESEVGRGSTFTLFFPLNPIQEHTA